MKQHRLNILFISSWFPNKVNPTLGNFVEKHAEAVSLYANVNVLHVCFSPSLIPKMEYVFHKRNNVNVHIIYLKKNKSNIPVITPLTKLCRIIKAYYFGFHKIYKNKKPDIIHANVVIPISLIAYCFKITKRIPYIITEHWTGFLPQNLKKPEFSMFLYRYFARKAAVLSPVTQNLASAMQDCKITGNFKIVPNVVEVNLFKQKRTHINKIKRILHISSLDDEQKNFSGILFAINELAKHRNDFVLDVISDGNYKQYLKKIEKLDISDKIVFHGEKTTTDVAEIICQCDFLLLFSNYENFPCVIAEAMSAGIAVLSTNVGGISEHVNESNGILIEPHNRDMLISELNIMLDTCQNYDSTKIRSYAKNHFSYEVIGKQYMDIYKSVLNKNKK